MTLFVVPDAPGGVAYQREIFYPDWVTAAQLTMFCSVAFLSLISAYYKPFE